MNILFFDTETSGLPINYKAPITDVDNWPRIVQLAYVITDETGMELSRHSTIVKPEGFTIPEEVTLIHGITTERALAEGESIRKVMNNFSYAVLKSGISIGHNVSFDRLVVGAEMIRLGMEDILSGRPRICTMIKSTRHCELPGRYSFKWPKLEELYFKLFGESKEGLHDAAADVDATIKCFFELRRLGVITDADMVKVVANKKVESF